MKYVMLICGCLMVSSLCGVQSIPFDEMKEDDTFVPLEKASDESFVFHTTGIVTSLPGSPPPLASNDEEKKEGTLVIEREGTDVRPMLAKVLRGKSAFTPCQGGDCGGVVVSTGFAKTGKYSGKGGGGDSSPPSDNVVRID